MCRFEFSKIIWFLRFQDLAKVINDGLKYYEEGVMDYSDEDDDEDEFERDEEQLDDETWVRKNEKRKALNVRGRSKSRVW